MWSFMTTEFTLIDDFESYMNDSPIVPPGLMTVGASADDFFLTARPATAAGPVGYDPCRQHWRI
jgi:hypothetical protein